MSGTHNGAERRRDQQRRRAVSHTKDRKEENLLPGIPDEITLTSIVTKVPWSTVVTLSALSRAWLRVVRSRDVYDARVRTGSTQFLLPIVHYYPHTRQKVAISLYDPARDEWRRLPAIPGVKSGLPYYCGCVCLKGKLYILGGIDHENGHFFEHTREVYVLDLAAGKLAWTRCAKLTHQREGPACGVFDGRIYVFGGVFRSRESRFYETEVFDPEQNLWRLASPECAHFTSLHKVSVVGGTFFLQKWPIRSAWQNGPSLAPRSAQNEDLYFGPSLAQYDSVKDEWQTCEFLQETSNGRLVEIDQRLHKVSFTSTEAYDPQSNSWEAFQYNSWQFRHSGTVEDLQALTASGEQLMGIALARIPSESRRKRLLFRSKWLGCKDRGVIFEDIDSSRKIVEWQDSLSPIYL